MPDDTTAEAKAQAVFDTLDTHDALIEGLQRQVKITMLATAGLGIATGFGVMMSMKCIKAVAQIGEVLNNWSPIVGAMAQMPVQEARPMHVEPRVPQEDTTAVVSDDVAPPAEGPVSEVSDKVRQEIESDPIDPATLDQVLGELREG